MLPSEYLLNIVWLTIDIIREYLDDNFCSIWFLERLLLGSSEFETVVVVVAVNVCVGPLGGSRAPHTYILGPRDGINLSYS